MMKKTAFLILIAMVLMPIAAFAQDGAALYKGKCQMCHGPDGAKMAKADFSKPAPELVKFLMTNDKHKSKVPDEATAKAVVDYIKTLKK
jgi:mono/diheme cytochrome c family protein